jgi:site-specific recombinase XerD
MHFRKFHLARPHRSTNDDPSRASLSCGSPARHLRLRRPPQAARRVLSTVQLLALSSAQDVTSAVGQRNTALVAIFQRLALDRAEAAALRVEDVNFTTGEVRIRSGPPHRHRELAMSGQLVAVLKRYIERVRPQFKCMDGNDTLFVTHGGRPVSAGYAGILLVEAGRRAGLAERITARTLRHSWVHAKLQEKADLQILRHFLGHKYVTSTESYTLHFPFDVLDIHKQTHPRARCVSHLKRTANDRGGHEARPARADPRAGPTPVNAQKLPIARST